jgi:hypothetical protein
MSSEAPAEPPPAAGAVEPPQAGQEEPAPVSDAPESQHGPLYALEYPPLVIGRTPNPKLIAQLLGACVILFVFAWLYIGAAWDPHRRLHRLHVAVLSCDAGVPAALAAAAPAMAATPALGTATVARALYAPASPAAGLLGWQPFACAAAAGAPSCAAVADACRAELVRAVERGDAWSALFVPAGFTAAVLSNIPALGLNATTASMEHLYSTGRSLSTYTFIRSAVAATAAGMQAALAQSALASPTLGAALGRAFYIAPFALVSTDLHPVTHLGQHFASYVLCVLLWMGSAFSAALVFQFKTRAEVDALASTRRVAASEALRTLAAKSLLAVCFSFLQAIALVAVLLCLGGYGAGAGAHHGCQWAHNPGVAIAYGAYMAWSFLSINALCLHVLGQERFTAVTTCVACALQSRTPPSHSERFPAAAAGCCLLCSSRRRAPSSARSCPTASTSSAAGCPSTTACARSAPSSSADRRTGCPSTGWCPPYGARTSALLMQASREE